MIPKGLRGLAPVVAGIAALIGCRAHDEPAMAAKIELRWGTTLMLPRPISPDLAIAPNRQLVIEFDQRGHA